MFWQAEAFGVPQVLGLEQQKLKEGKEIL